jgi:hypothetical protein
MKGRVETRSENARHVILKYEDKVYHVSRVNVHCSEGKKGYSAVFSAKRLEDNKSLDLDFEISRSLYDVLVEYTKLEDSDLLLVLQVEGDDFKWGLVSDSWLRQQAESKISRYVV